METKYAKNKINNNLKLKNMSCKICKQKNI